MSSLAIIAALKKYKVIPQLEGDKIRLVGETKSLPEELLALIKAEKKELISFLLKAMDQVASSTITPVALQENYPASNAQERLWVLSQFDGGTTAYNIATSLYLSGIVNHELLEKAFQAVIQRHESIRTVFKEVNGELRQIILDEIPFSIIYEDISHYPEMSAFLKEEADRSANWHFDLEKGPLMKVKLFRMSGEEHALIFGIHHIVCDGWSVNTLIREVMLVYNAYTRQEKIVETPLRINYKDYTDWLKKKINGSSGDAAKVFWKEQFNPPAEPLHLFTDFPRPPVKSFEGAYASFYLDESRYKGMVAFCREHQITLFNFLRATVNLLLYKYSGQERIVIGTPVSGRNHYDLAEQIGLYVNTLPLVLEIDPEDTLIGFLKKMTANSLSAFEHQEYPLDKIIDDLQIKRDPGRNPLFDVMMVLQGSAMEESANGNLSKEGFALGLLKNYLYPAGRINDERRGAKFDLSFYFDNEPDNRFVIEIEYALSLFQQSTIHRLFNTYLFIISEVLKAPGKKIRELASVDEAVQEVLLCEFNAPVGSIEEHSLAGLLQPSFAANGDKIALITKDSTFSYNTLAEMSDRVAAYLQPGNEAADQQVTCLLMGRSEWMIISMLAILKTGSAYMTIDITYPVGRIQYMLEDAAPACLIVDDAGAGKVPEGYRGRIIHIKELKMLPVSVPVVIPAIDLREHIAYLIYTSGSTGQPKGVTICHRNVMAFLKWALEEFSNTPYEVLYATTSYCFDLSVFEIFLPLLQGKTIRLLESALQIPAWVTSDRQVMINTVPSVVRTLLDEDMKWEHVVALNMAGEPLSPKIIHDLQGTQMEIRNLYGPSEGTTYTTVYRFEKGTEQVIPIGKPVKYTQLYILDKYMHPVPIGVEGEIYLGGQLIAKGYLHKPVLTAERFIKNPYLPGTLMYKTGDSGRWMPDGNVLFTGRLDDQIKIRGYRIEPGEVQYCIEKHPSVDQAVVTVHTINGEQQLAAYWTSSIDLSTVVLKDYLASLLPAFMVPAYFIKLESIPVNSNGKTDKKQLPLPFPEKAAMVIRPENELQQKILDIWAGVLDTTEFGITDNFFELGGHSLKATRLRSLIAMDLQREISLQDIFRYPTIKEQALHLDKKTDGQLLYIPRTATADAYPISFAQERLWVLTKFNDASKAYNMSAAFVIHGKIDIGKFETAFKMVIERHEVLRTTLTTASGEPVQVVHKPEDLMFAIEKINVGNTLKTGAVYALLQEEWQKPFDLERGPLLRCQLISTPDEQLLSFSMHHIISDGWSVMVLFKDVTTIYRHLVNGLDTALPELSFQYRDFSVWQRQFLTGEQLASHLSYWQEILSGELPVLELPTDHPRPDVKTYEGATWRTRFSPLLTQQMHLLAVNNGVSLFMVLHAAVNVLLKKYTDQQDIITGTPIAGRNGYELEGQIGFYVNTLPIRIKINGEMSFHSLLSEERTTLISAYEHQELPFELLTGSLALRRDLSRSPVFDVMVVLQNLEGMNRDAMKKVTSELELHWLDVNAGTAKYDLTFTFSEEAGSLQLELEYNTSLFEEATVSRMSGHLKNLFKQVVATPAVLIKDISLQDEVESALLLSKADNTNISYDRHATLVSLFSQAAARYPNHIALVADGEELTYSMLDTLSGQLAKQLINVYNVQAEDLVVLHFDRNKWMLIGILAVLKAGAAYVPVDPAYPTDRIDYIIADCGTSLILSDQPIRHSCRVIDITSLDYSGSTEQVIINPEQLAYVIYTSGTTGQPKGVLIEHRNVTRLLFNDKSLFDFHAGDHWSLFHSYCFDFSVWEMYGALLKGGTLVMVPKAIAQDSIACYDFLHREKITVFNQTPTAFRSLVQQNRHRFLKQPLMVRYLIFGGETLMPEILQEWQEIFPACRNINMYGITETTVHVTFKEITDKEIRENKSIIGLPIPTLSCYILDSDLKQVPVGIAGELCVGGAGVARGYLNRSELTAKKFIDHPLNKEGKLYRSGDYARILPSGDLEYIGRKDEQVKIRGHRIEIAEVEANITRQEGISDAVVVALKEGTGDYALVAYYISDDIKMNSHLLRKMLGDALPVYMVPSYLIAMEAFPMNSNGKLDKTALPKPSDNTEIFSGYQPCRNETDRQIVAIWEQVLEKKPIGIRDNFFDLGGHSLKATRVLARLHEVFGVQIDLRNLFIDPTVEHLSNYIETIQWMDEKNNVLVEGNDELIF